MGRATAWDISVVAQPMQYSWSKEITVGFAASMKEQHKLLKNVVPLSVAFGRLGEKACEAIMCSIRLAVGIASAVHNMGCVVQSDWP